MATVLEIVQHAGEILSRLPLDMLKHHLLQVAPDDPNLAWYRAAHRLVESAQCVELDVSRLADLEAQPDPAPPEQPEPAATPVPEQQIPDDWWDGR